MTTEKNEDIFDAVFNVDKEKLIRVLDKDPKQIDLRIELESNEENTGYDLEGKYCLPIEILVANSDLSADIANDMFDILVEHGAKVNETSTYDGGTLLHSAASSGNNEIIKKIINSGVDINAVDEDGNTALHLAVSNIKDKSVKIIIENGGVPSTIIENKNGDLPINFIKPQLIENPKYKSRLDNVLDILKPITERELNKEFSQEIRNNRRPKL